MASVRGGELIELADMSAKPDPRKCLLSRPIAPRQIRTCLETPGFIGAEFKKLPEALVRECEYSSRTAHKNRYCNILPTPGTRVKLSSSVNSSSDYINANAVRGLRESRVAYIATQGPLPQTVCDFWQMIWEQGSKIIIMASGWTEGGIERSARYLPKEEGETISYDKFKVTLTETLTFKDYVYSILTLRMSGSQQGSQSSRQIRHYRITFWPSRGLPANTEKITTLLRTVKSWESEGPVVVHCASGAGRTGVVVAIDVGLQALLQREPVIDILRIASALKQDRGVLIQTPLQYRFINQALADMAKDLGLGK